MRQDFSKKFFKKLVLTQIKGNLLHPLKRTKKTQIINDVIGDYQTSVSFECKIEKQGDLSFGNANILNQIKI